MLVWLMYIYILDKNFFKTYYLANHFSGWIRNMQLETLKEFFKKKILTNFILKLNK